MRHRKISDEDAELFVGIDKKYFLFGLLLWFFSSVSWAADSCKVKYHIANEWNTGFNVLMTITNTGDSWAGWTTSWDMPDGQKVTGIWNGSYTQNETTVSIKDVGWNANVASGANVQFGFNGTHSGLNNIPSNVSVNGVLCEGNPQPPKPLVTACKVDYTISGQWDTGFNANVKVTNTGDPWGSWTATWDMLDGQQVTGFWSGSYSQDGAAVSIKSASWNGRVDSGATTEIKFMGSHSGLNRIPANVSINGVLCDGNPTPTLPVTSCEVNYSISKIWGSGFTADVTLKNTGDAFGDWTVTWDMPDDQQVTKLWNADHQQSGSRLSVTPLEWNRVVPEGELIKFGFNGIHFGLNNIPGNIALNGVKCDGQVDPPPPPPPSCHVDYKIHKQLNDSFSATVEIRNTGAPWNGWETTWTMPTGQVITGGWNAEFNQVGDKVSVKNVSFNKLIGTYNNSVLYGFKASHTGVNLLPIDIAVNGTRCDGQADTLLLPPNAPDNLQAVLTDNTYVNLNWQDNSDNEDNLVLERREAGGHWLPLATLDADTLTYRDSTLLVGNRYEYRLKAVNSAFSSAYTNTVSVKRQDLTDIRALMLVNNCASCHGTDGYSSGSSIPSIAGLDRDYIARTMKAYRSGERFSSIMGRVASGYTDTQIERMADYLSKLPFQPAEQTTTPALVQRGRAVHESGCVFCHTGTGDDSSRTGTRLDGQWATYLHATMEGYYLNRSSNIPPEMADQMQDLKTLYGEDILQALAEYYAADATSKTVEDTTDNGSGDNTGGDTSGGSDSDNGTDTGGDSGSDTSTGGNSDSDSSGDTVVIAPVAPSTLTATTVDNRQINLSWRDNSHNETGFRVERRATEATDTDWVSVAELGSNTKTYVDTSVTAGASYDYRLTAFNTVGNASSDIATASLQTTLVYGQNLYQQQGCASCHGVDGKGGFTQVDLTRYTTADLTSLGSVIHDTMPPGNPAACSSACADSMASYIIDYLASNTVNEDEGNTQACAGTSPAGIRSLRLLTRLEYQNTVNDLFSLSLNLVNSLPDENTVAGFDNNIEQNQVSSLRLEAYLTQAEKIAAQAIQDSWSNIMPCSQQDQACGRQFIQTFGKRAFRRPLTTDEVDAFTTNFNGVAFDDAVEKTVMSMLIAPEFLYRFELGELQANGTYQLTPYEIASSLSYLFWGSMPDEELFQAADNNALNTPTQRITQASRLLEDKRSRQQVGHFVGQWLLEGSPYALPTKDVDIYPAYTDAVKAAMSQELINFFNYVTFDSTQSFDELYRANYVIANKALADFYHLSGPIGDAFEWTPVTDGTRTGLLTLGAVLARYSNSNESHPFMRGRFFFERVLCHELPEPANFGLVQPPDPDPEMTTRQRFDFHSNTFESCYSCHQYLDGPGFGFENYDGSGQFRNMENGNVIDASAIVRGMETYTPTEELTFTDLKHLSQLVSDSPTAAQCVAKQYYRYTTGRKETSADQCALESYLQTYEDSGYNLQTMLISIVNAPNFIVRRAQ
jgi:cytochrome c553/cellulase/cellobiase CelA1